METVDNEKSGAQIVSHEKDIQRVGESAKKCFRIEIEDIKEKLE